MCLNFVEERTQKCDRENREQRWYQIKSICRLHLDLVVVPLSEIKSYVVVLSFYIKMMKRRTLQACSLRHNIKKGMFSVQGKLGLFDSGRGRVLPSPLPLGYAPAQPVNTFFTLIIITLEQETIIESVLQFHGQSNDCLKC